MKLTVPQNELSKALNTVSRTAKAQPGQPLLANVLLRTDDTKLIVTATNLEVVIVDTIGAKVEEQGAITVPAKLLTEFVNNLPKTNIDIKTEENRIKITAGGYKSTINSQKADDYPAIPESNENSQFTVSSDLLRSAISETVLVTSADTTRPILTGVYFHTVDGVLYLAATDGYRLAERRAMALEDEVDMIVPADALQDVIRIAANANEVTVKYSDDQISFIADEARITSRLIDGKYISYRQLIPTDTTFKIQTDRDEFIKIVKVAELFARESAGTVIIESKADTSELAVRSITSQMGDNISSIDADIQGGDSMVSVNSKFLLDALNCIKGEKVTIRYNGKMSPVLLMGDDDIYKHIVMPVKS